VTATNHIDIIGNSEHALRDPELGKALGTTLPVLRRMRNAAAAEVPEWQLLRTIAAQAKDHVLANLEKYLVELEARVSALGGHVHWAEDAAEARRIIVDLAESRSVRRIVKSKSMVTEEIHLNPALEAKGIKVVETDLGEYVVQLSGDTPSHIVAPIAHKTAASVAQLFVEKLGLPRYEKPEEMTRAARDALRSEFMAADMGITGVNFAIAETGTIVVVENEGNARLSMTRPRVHVAVMGIEKVLARLADLGVLLRVLARSATGQRASVYVSLITGPRRPGETDGPEEFHLVLVDNGRARVLADPELRDVLRCIRCGACQNVCPVFERTGGHAYGSVYGGPIGAVLTPAFEGIDRARDLPFASSLCGACGEVCPVKIDLPRMLLDLRHRAVSAGVVGRIDRVFARVWTFAMRSPKRLSILSSIARTAQRVVVRQGRIERLPYPLHGWTRYRTAPPIAASSFRSWWSSRRSRGATEKPSP
jgi:L-lactate dehydrogenase complex protein LldF